MQISLVGIEPLVVDWLQNFLYRSGHQVTTFHTIRGLAKQIKSEPKTIDTLITTPIILGKKTRKILLDLHRGYPDFCVLMIIEDRPPLSTEEAVSFGISAYLHKPISLAELELLLTQQYKSKSENQKEVSYSV